MNWMNWIRDFSTIPALTILCQLDARDEICMINGKVNYGVLEFDKFKNPHWVAPHNYKKAESLPDDHPMKYYNPINYSRYILAEGITLEMLIKDDNL